MGHIVLVESDPAGRDVLCGVLERAGHTVRVAAGAGEAVRYLRDPRPDCLLLDLANGPGFRSLLDHLRTAPDSGSVPVVLLAGCDAGAPEPELAGFPLVPRPFTRSRLLAGIDAALSVA